jgi:hypothetical protein
MSCLVVIICVCLCGCCVRAWGLFFCFVFLLRIPTHLIILRSTQYALTRISTGIQGTSGFTTRLFQAKDAHSVNTMIDEELIKHDMYETFKRRNPVYTTNAAGHPRDHDQPLGIKRLRE